MQHLERFLGRLQGVSRSGSGWKARCPCPDHGAGGRGDRNPSLSIGVGDENKILLYCFGGCPQDAVLEALGLEFQDLWPGDGDPGPADTAAPAAPAAEKAAPDLAFRHRVYSALLEKTKLSDRHRRDLRARGLDDGRIDTGGYRSLSLFDLKQAAARLREEFGDRLLEVPGFVERMGKVAAVELPGGLLIPVREAGGGIVACQFRCDGGPQKYLWLSGGATGSGAPAHVPLGVRGASVVRITEGALKADVAFALDGEPTVGVAGVTSWREAIPPLHRLAARTVVLAFDADAEHKPGVAAALADCANELAGPFDVRLAVWAGECGKGIDDLLHAGGKPTILQGAAVGDHLRALLERPARVEEADADGVSHRVVAGVVPETASGDHQEPVVAATPETRTTTTPERFPYGLGDPAPFPLAAFPPRLQEIAREIARALHCPIDFVACAMLTVAATAIGRSRQVEPLDDWAVCARIYMGLVGEPGSGKSPALAKVARPLWQQNAGWVGSYTTDKEAHELEKLAYEARMKEYARDLSRNAQAARERARNGDDEAEPPAVEGAPTTSDDADEPDEEERRLALPPRPLPPVLKQVVVNDVTTEKLAVIMGNNPRGIVRITDELTAFIRMMNQYSGGRGPDRQFYLSCWSGGTVQVDRKSQDTPVVVREPFVNVLGGIQPDMLGALEDERGREDGFIHRFFFCYPLPAGRRDWHKASGVSRSVRSDWKAVVDWLLALAMQEPDEPEQGSAPQPRTLRFTPEAEAAWKDWNNRHNAETGWDCFPPQLRGLWSKFETHTLVLVLVAHMLKVAAEHATTGKEYTQNDPPIDLDSLRRGLALADYFKDHNVRVLDRLQVRPEDKQAERAIAWIRKRPNRQASARDLVTNGVAGVKTASEARTLLKNLEDRGLGELRSQPGRNDRQQTGRYFQASA